MDLPDMGFVGFNSSFCTVLCADMAANWLVRYADGQLARQPSAAEMSENIAMMLRFKRVERPAAGVYGGLCVAPYHFKHFDELLADIGATSRRRTPTPMPVSWLRLPITKRWRRLAARLPRRGAQQPRQMP